MAGRMAPEELAEQLDDERVLIIDVRSKEKYREGHVPGALNIPVNQIKQEVPDLPKEKQIVTY